MNQRQKTGGTVSKSRIIILLLVACHTQEHASPVSPQDEVFSPEN